ncbi:hypothetical protein D9M71_674520 [compost metagenome]
MSAGFNAASTARSESRSNALKQIMSLSRNNVCPLSGPKANAANLLPMGYRDPKGFSIGHKGMERLRKRRRDASLRRSRG